MVYGTMLLHNVKQHNVDYNLQSLLQHIYQPYV